MGYPAAPAVAAWLILSQRHGYEVQLSADRLSASTCLPTQDSNPTLLSSNGLGRSLGIAPMLSSVAPIRLAVEGSIAWAKLDDSEH